MMMQAETVEPGLFVLPASQIAEPTAGLRFVTRDGKRILQQLWQVWLVHGHAKVSCSDEWRDVPLAEDAA